MGDHRRPARQGHTKDTRARETGLNKGANPPPLTARGLERQPTRPARAVPQNTYKQEVPGSSPGPPIDEGSLHSRDFALHRCDSPAAG